MNKCICDICNKNEANHKFKVKKYMMTDYILGKFGYRKVDICDSCYRKLMRIPADKKIEEEIWDCVSDGAGLEKYETEELNSAYCDGIDTILNMLVHRKILKL